jgi:hypothetical protein
MAEAKKRFIVYISLMCSETDERTSTRNIRRTPSFRPFAPMGKQKTGTTGRFRYLLPKDIPISWKSDQIASLDPRSPEENSIQLTNKGAVKPSFTPIDICHYTPGE